MTSQLLAEPVFCEILHFTQFKCLQNKKHDAKSEETRNQFSMTVSKREIFLQSLKDSDLCEAHFVD